IAAAELASISERRWYKLVSGTRGLPAFLVNNPGLNSGFMIAQYAAASAVSQNKQLATPASVDTIDSSNGQEDHVSMGANAATKLFRIVQNLEKVIAIEWFSATQALEFREEKTASKIQQAIKIYRSRVHFLKNDEVMYPYMEQSREFVRKYEV
ncbi:MAG: histidine ammonia-lyase, partial [Bacteroidetes bacterium]